VKIKRWRTTSLAALGALALVPAAFAVASARDGDAPAPVAPLAEHVQTRTAGYDVTVHPAFSSHITLLGQSGASTELYRQQGTHNLPAGQTQAPAQHVIKLQGGQFGRDVGFVVNDPRHQIARITVELYGPEHQPGMQGSPVVERVVISNDAKTCPPHCDTGSGGTQ
jgi:hypothetical protein